MNGAPDWGQLALDIDLAARVGAPVLISAPAGCAENLARAIAVFSSASHGARVVICDCAGGGSLARAVADARAARHEPDREAGCPGPADVTLVLREVHALGQDEQREVARIVAASFDDPTASGHRIIATTSVSLFDRVRDGAFDERLFYRLNVLHIVISGREDAPRD